MAENQWVFEHFLQGQLFARKQWMASGQRNDQGVMPDILRVYPITAFVRAGKAGVIQVVSQSLDLLGERHFKQADFHLGFI